MTWPGRDHVEAAPVETTEGELINKGQEEDPGKYEHRDQTKGAKGCVLDRPWVQEHDLDVEHDEQHGNQIEPDREAFGGVDSVSDATLVRGGFSRGVALGRKQLRRRDAEQHEHHSEHTERQDRKVLLHGMTSVVFFASHQGQITTMELP